MGMIQKFEDPACILLKILTHP